MTVEKNFPKLKAKGELHKKLIINMLGGFWNVLDKEGQRYFQIMCILIDKSVYEFNCMRDYVVEEIKGNDRLSYRLRIIGHLENSINAISRANKILNIIFKGVKKKGKMIKKNQEIIKFIEKNILNRINDQNILKIRNRIEHIEEDIFSNKIKGAFLVDMDDRYQGISINNKSMAIKEFVLLIDNFEELALDIFCKLPNRIEGDKYYYADGRTEIKK